MSALGDGIPSEARRGRRPSVFAAPPDESENWTPKKFPKLAEQEKAISDILKDNILFENLDSNELQILIDACIHVTFQKGQVVIEQGAEGDRYYIISEGTVEIFVSHGEEGRGNKVAEFGPGKTFGELALLYDSPRAATVVVQSDACELWALDRDTFKRLLQKTTQQKRNKYAGFVEKVPLLNGLTWYERMTVADALEALVFKKGEVIVKQGDTGDTFYIIEDGSVDVLIEDNVKVASLGPGDYFGEIALLHDQPRAATVSAFSESDVTVLALGRDVFTRMFGPLQDEMNAQSARRLDEIKEKRMSLSNITPPS